MHSLLKIYGNASGQRITFIDRPKGSARPDLMRCTLCWETPTLLLIGWADYVKIAQVNGLKLLVYQALSF